MNSSHCREVLIFFLERMQHQCKRGPHDWGEGQHTRMFLNSQVILHGEGSFTLLGSLLLRGEPLKGEKYVTLSTELPREPYSLSDHLSRKRAAELHSKEKTLLSMKKEQFLIWKRGESGGKAKDLQKTFPSAIWGGGERGGGGRGGGTFTGGFFLNLNFNEGGGSGT